MAIFRQYRDVFLDGDTAQIVDDATAKHHRFDEAWMGLEWLIARKPDVGIRAVVGGVDWWLYVEQSDPVAKTPEIWVVYTADDDRVDIKGMVVKAYAEPT